ncbi:MAG: HNH endonuclease [Verrucomicrobia bacterium]|nr:HNH endonuclease [Verrucomicrobiota bacterium]
MNGELPLGDTIRLPTKRSPAVARFCRKVRLARGNTCENCGATPSERQIESHHILDYHVYPSLGKDEDNIIVLCQACHRGLSRPHGDLLGDRLMRLAQLRPELRERIASYVERKAPYLTNLIRIVRAGEQAASYYFFRRLEM